MARVHDIAVLGATPAGLAAAHYLARKKLDVVVVDGPREPVECPLSDWVPCDFFRRAGLPRSLARSCGAQPFRRVRYHNMDLSQEADYVSRSAAGHFLEHGKLVQALKAAASKAGARVVSSDRLPGIALEEDQVALRGRATTRARLLLIAQDRPDLVFAELGLPARTVPRSALVVAGINVPLPDRAARAGLTGTLHVAESPERTELGMFFASGPSVHLRIISDSPASGTRVAEMSGMVANFQRAGKLPANLPLGRARGAVWRPPAGVALELEGHVAKRCLLAGTAGGFSESITGQTLYPSVWSALLAADAAAQAIRSPHVQETLMHFKVSWRKSLADYLRPPNTSLHMLLPLLFVNRRIIAKFTRALLYGENI